MSERVAKVVPRAQLIALLRNPVDRVYSQYQQVVGKGQETRTFEEVIGFEDATIEAKRTQALGEQGETSALEEDQPALMIYAVVTSPGASTWTSSCAGLGSSPKSRCSC